MTCTLQIRIALWCRTWRRALPPKSPLAKSGRPENGRKVLWRNPVRNVLPLPSAGSTLIKGEIPRSADRRHALRTVEHALRTGNHALRKKITLCETEITLCERSFRSETPEKSRSANRRHALRNRLAGAKTASEPTQEKHALRFGCREQYSPRSADRQSVIFLKITFCGSATLCERSITLCEREITLCERRFGKRGNLSATGLLNIITFVIM